MDDTSIGMPFGISAPAGTLTDNSLSRPLSYDPPSAQPAASVSKSRAWQPASSVASQALTPRIAALPSRPSGFQVGLPQMGGSPLGMPFGIPTAGGPPQRESLFSRPVPYDMPLGIGSSYQSEFDDVGSEEAFADAGGVYVPPAPNAKKADDGEGGDAEGDSESSESKVEERGPYMSPTANQSYCINGLDATPITKRLYDIVVADDEDLVPTTRVDLSHPLKLPIHDHRAGRVDYCDDDFGPLAETPYTGYNGYLESVPYFGKSPVKVERPWIELGRGQYLNGPVPTSQTWLGKKNLVAPRFLAFGDFRAGVAFNDNGAVDQFVNAYRLNLNLDLQITSTERIQAFIGPLDRGGNFTRVATEDDDLKFSEEFDADFDNIFFEGDLGAMLGGALDIYAPFDMPIAFGIMPMLFQNGNWMLDNFLGAAVTIPARHNAKLLWSNYDVTFFTGIDEINSPAFPGDDSQATIYGAHAFIEAYTGYLEVGYAFLEDELNEGLSYHNVGVSFSRRYFQRLSNSVRFIANFGQAPNAGAQTADGQLILIENSWITADYTHVVPYMNFFAGFDRPQSVARAGGVGGVLLNTGINFESDGLTGYPTLDASANNTYGGAVGLNLLGPDFSWQVVTEFAVVATHGNRANRIAPGNQYGFGVRVQKPITNAWLTRFDTMFGIRDQLDDLFGIRFEMRYKF